LRRSDRRRRLLWSWSDGSDRSRLPHGDSHRLSGALWTTTCVRLGWWHFGQQPACGWDGGGRTSAVAGG
jgi:hypothetical protein